MIRLSVLSLLLIVSACRQRPAAVSVSPSGQSCIVTSDSTPPRDTVTLAYAEPVHLPNAPVALNEAERIFFRHTNETLVWRDCNGSLKPGLALRWSHDSAGTTWTFELDSLALRRIRGTAEGVVAAWNARRNGGIWPWPHMLDVRASGAYQLSIRLDTAVSELPEAFADPALSVPGIPFQTGAVVRPSAGPLVELIHLVPADRSPRPVIRFQVLRRGVDERDFLDLPRVSFVQSADVLITRTPAVVDYALRKPGFRPIALPWDRTHVVIGDLAGLPGLEDTTRFRQSLARDVVQGESRAASGPFWWDSSSCPGTKPITPMGRLPQVVYPRGDLTAQALAERLVALHRVPLHAMALGQEEFAASLAGGEAKLYVFPLSRIASLGCPDRPSWPSEASLLPLVDTRPVALIRPGVSPFRIEGDGIIRFEPGGGRVPRAP